MKLVPASAFGWPGLVISNHIVTALPTLAGEKERSEIADSPLCLIQAIAAPAVVDKHLPFNPDSPDG